MSLLTRQQDQRNRRMQAFLFISDSAIVDNGLGCGVVLLPTFRAFLGTGVSGFSLFGRCKIILEYTSS